MAQSLLCVFMIKENSIKLVEELPEKSNQRGKDHVQLVPLFDWFGFGCMGKYKQNQIYWFGQFQTCQTGDQPYSDTSPSSQFSLNQVMIDVAAPDCLSRGSVLPFKCLPNGVH